jgi:hypothetical protein
MTALLTASFVSVVPEGGGHVSDISMPVCAIDPKIHKRHTYGNPCQAEVADATVVSEGACH